MKSISTRSMRFATFLLLASLVASCAPTGPANPRLVAAQKTYAQGMAIGAVGGAAAGAVIGHQIDHDGGALVGALAGAAIGAVAGNVWASHVVRQRTAYRNASEYLSSCTERARKSRIATENYNAALKREIAHTKVGDKTIRNSIQRSQTVLDSTHKEIGLQKQALVTVSHENVSTSSISQHNAELRRLEQEERLLKAHMDRLTRLEGTPQSGAY